MNWKRKTCNLHLHVIPHVYVHDSTYTLTLFDTRIFIFEGGGGFLKEEEEEEEEEEDIECRLQ